MSFQLAYPSLFLSKYVKQYWSIESHTEVLESYKQRIIPNGIVELTFYFQTIPKVLDDRKQFSGNSLISGQQKKFYDLKIGGKLNMISVSFQPQGAMMFLDLPVHKLYNLNVSLVDLCKENTPKLEDQLSSANSFESRVKIIEDFLIRRIIKKPKNYYFDRIEYSLSALNKSRGMVSIDRLASLACLSRRQYERYFLEHIGTSPKQFIKLIRFQHVLLRKQKHPELNLTSLAYDCGYYDQSHMTSEFKSISGLGPRQYFQSCEPYSDYFQ